MKVAIIGAGNVSWHFTMRLLKHSSIHLSIHSRDELNSTWKSFPQSLIRSLSKTVSPDTECVIIAVNDDHIGSILHEYSVPTDCTIVHTSGTQPLQTLTDHSKYTGVIYPLQTLTQGVPEAHIPLYLESNSKQAETTVKQLASLLSDTFSFATSEERRVIHLSAVFASNFVNHQLLLAEEILRYVNLPLAILEPLVRQTIEKAIKHGPLIAQTGPAIRNDLKTIQLHESMIHQEAALSIYKLLTSSIRNSGTKR
ncbi:MAG: putative short-subunit dehydrogenase-like oxidoreductase (DUF2520 family) [Cyclobacteriaceae bacterium]|jgi:predicted short-subunit dehydrogenase-like oxidoreductase (DUF2520 family)